MAVVRVPEESRMLVEADGVKAYLASIGIDYARWTPEHPLVVPEDLYGAKVTAISAAAGKMGISPGMTGLQAVERMQKTA